MASHPNDSLPALVAQFRGQGQNHNPNLSQVVSTIPGNKVAGYRYAETTSSDGSVTRTLEVVSDPPGANASFWGRLWAAMNDPQNQ